MGSLNGLEVAVIGMSGRFPGAKDIDEFWQLLVEGKEGLTVYTDEELLAAGAKKEEINSPRFVRKQGVLKDKDLFDAPLFGYSAKEAQIMDPQFRILHESIWQALENAGYDSERYQGLIGLYAGAGNNIDWMKQYIDEPASLADLFTLDTVTTGDYLTTRIAYAFNLRGPAVTVQTACSSSLVAIHQACQSLNTGECDIALAGGVYIPSLDNKGYAYQEGMIMSPDGSCRPFDQQANGTNSSEGCGIVVLKRLEESQADGDNILAVVKGSAINNDGRDKVGFTAPGMAGQLRLLRSAYQVAEIDPESISYIEAHGTGTPLGDPIEIEALTQVFNTNKTNYCKIGSVKSNIGHTVIAAGVASVIKTILAIQHRQIPPSINFDKENPHIDFNNSPFTVSTELSDWHGENGVLRAGVSSFGIGGTNAHIIIENYQLEQLTTPSRSSNLVSLSANSVSALDSLSTKLRQHVTNNPLQNLADLCYTLHVGRKTLSYRKAFTAQSLADIGNKLDAKQSRSIVVGTGKEKDGKICFMFPGQGAQYVEMGKQLYQQETVFQQQLDECLDIIEKHSDIDFNSVLFPTAEQYLNEQINNTAYAQPLLFAFEYALAKLLISWNCKPDMMIGHSVGEYVCACLSGVFSLSDALLLVVRRGALIKTLPPGCMLSVACSESHISGLLNEHLSLSAINGAERVVIGGGESAIRELEEELDKQSISYSRLPISHAFHSHHMDPVIDEFIQVLEKIDFSTPSIAFMSNTTGRIASAKEVMSVSYWVKHLRQSVLFFDAIQYLAEEEKSYVYIEVGPGTTLTKLLKQSLGKEDTPACINLNKGINGRESEYEDFCAGLGKMFVAGVEIDWSAYYSQESRRRLALPTYPFEGKRYRKKMIKRKEMENETKFRCDMEDWLYLPGWKPLAEEYRKNAEKIDYFWVVFTDDYGIGDAICKQLKISGKEFVQISQGKKYEQLEKENFEIDPCAKQNYKRLTQQISEMTTLPLNVIHLWSVWPARKDITDAAVKKAKDLGFNSLLSLVQALEQENSIASSHINIVTSNLHRVTDESKLCSEKALVLGINKVLSQELRTVSSRNIDLYLQPDGKWLKDVSIDQLLKQCRVFSFANVLAIRGGVLWQQVYHPVSFPKIDNPKGLRIGGTYLITGGLGRIGLLLSEHLASYYGAKVILTTRQLFPKKSEWRSIVESDDTHTWTDTVKRLLAFEKSGSTFDVIKADVGDLTEMQSLFDWIDSHYGVLNGIFHVAAKVGSLALMDLSVDQAESYFLSKVKGTLNLAQLASSRELDFCMLFSSISTVLGGVGFTAYAAANNFLNSFVENFDNQSENRWLSVNWDAWAVDNRIKAGEVEKYAIQPDEGIKLLLPLLMLNNLTSSVLVSTRNLNFRYKQFVGEQVCLPREEVSSDVVSHARPGLITNYVAPESDTEIHLTELWQEYLGLEKVGVNDSFFDLGGDSLLGMRLISKINQDFGIEIPIQMLLTHHTISGFAGLITDKSYLQKAGQNFDNL